MHSVICYLNKALISCPNVSPIHFTGLVAIMALTIILAMPYPCFFDSYMFLSFSLQTMPQLTFISKKLNKRHLVQTMGHGQPLSPFHAMEYNRRTGKAYSIGR